MILRTIIQATVVQGVKEFIDDPTDLNIHHVVINANICRFTKWLQN